MNGSETIPDRLRRVVFNALHILPVAEKSPPVVEAVAPVPPEKDTFLEQQAAALVKITKDPELTEVVVDQESGLHRLVKAEEITVKI